MEISGVKIVEIKPEQAISEKFRKRDFVVEYASNPDYPQFVLFELTQNRTSLIDGYQPGEIVTVTFDIKGRRYEKAGEVRYFNSLHAFRIERAGGGDPLRQTPAPTAGRTALPAHGSDEMPF